MALSPQEQAELEALQAKFGAPKTIDLPGAIKLNPQEDAELKELHVRFSPKASIENLKSAGKLSDRFNEAADLGLEFSGVPALGRTGGKLLSGEMPATMDMAQLALMGGGGLLAKGLGATYGAIAKGIGGAAAGGAAGQFIAGPEARELANEFRGENPSTARKVGGFLIESAPSIIGSLGMGPALAGAGRGIKSVVSKTPGMKSLPEWAQVAPPAAEAPTGVGALSRAQQKQVLEGLKTSKYVTPEVMAKAERIEKALGIKLRPGQIESIGKKNLLSDGPLMDVEYSLARTDPAMRTYERQARHFEELLNKKGEALAPGVVGKDATKIGGELQAGTIQKIKDAAQAMDDIDDILINQAEANAFNLSPQKHIVEGLEKFLKENNAVGKTQARISDDAIKLTKHLIKEAKTRVKSLSQAIDFKRNVVGPETEKAFQALGNGSGKASDGYTAAIYHIFPEAIQASGKESPELAAIVKQYAEAAGKWKNVSGKPFDTVKALTGVLNRDESLIIKSPEKVVADVIGKQDLGWIPKIQEAADKGLVDMNLVRQAAYSDFLKRATKSGEAVNLADPKLVERVSAAWKRMNPSTRQALFGTDSIDDVMETLNVLTAPHRYAPNASGTARASQVLGRGKPFLSRFPGGRKLLNVTEGVKNVAKEGKARSFFESDAYRPTAAPQPMQGTAQVIDVGTQAGSIEAAQYRRNKKRNPYR